MVHLLNGGDGRDDDATALCLPFDGYHHSPATLRNMMMMLTASFATADDNSNNSEQGNKNNDLIYRLGAPDTRFMRRPCCATCGSFGTEDAATVIITLMILTMT